MHWMLLLLVCCWGLVMWAAIPLLRRRLRWSNAF